MPDLQPPFPLTSASLSEITPLHLAAFPQSAMSKLGYEAVRRYYAWLLTDHHPEAHRIGVEREGKLAGFCFGGRFNSATGGFMQRNRNFLLGQLLLRPWLLFNPLFRDRIGTGLTVLRRIRQQKTNPPPAIDWQTLKNPSFGILAIATDPVWQGQGVGRQLMVAAEIEARGRGCRRMHLTVHPDNHNAIAFYEKLGWHKDRPKGVPWDGMMVLPLK